MATERLLEPSPLGARKLHGVRSTGIADSDTFIYISSYVWDALLIKIVLAVVEITCEIHKSIETRINLVRAPLDAYAYSTLQHLSRPVLHRIAGSIVLTS